MHAYQGNQDERKRIHFFFAICSVPLAWLLGRALKATGWELWWLDAPAVWGIYVALCKGFSKWGWRLHVLRKIGVVTTPDFAGSYTGKLRTSHDEVEREVTMRIVQEFDRMQVRWEGPMSISRSVAASVICEDGAGPRLLYSYTNAPDAMAPDALVVHDGTCELELDVAGMGLRGHYYNGRGRKNHGAVTFTRRP
ncbi:MAG: hypothetical protein A2428_03660 [Bdellovibrionales bacterium RIFOXYC1_FULL_54_43]|nr:MAG: hypothetical protein A2428_03660 [Bdellovibrionales bacterium RIFOXYC1_FULL_54_43]OFZ83808.1 MAG: hypothetical protein A2603_11085 [Bdellovibrionales bacterium RIFOXYD1_FULL_55_31]